MVADVLPGVVLLFLGSKFESLKLEDHDEKKKLIAENNGNADDGATTGEIQ